jgi:hypothetical protein
VNASPCGASRRANKLLHTTRETRARAIALRREDVVKLNELEAAVLMRMAQSNEWLEALIGKLVVSKRELTGAGSYTDFEPSSAAVEISDRYDGFIVQA